MRRRWKSALAAGPPPAKPAAAMVPVSDTATFFTSGCTGAAASMASKSFLPSEFITAGPGEALVEEHRPIRHRLVELFQRGVTMLGPLVRVPAAHRGDPLPLGHALAARGERLLHLFDRGRVLEDGVVAGAVGQADDVDVRLDQAGHHRAALEVDDAGARGARQVVADAGDAVVVDVEAADDAVGAVQRVDAAVGEEEVLRGAPAPAGAAPRACASSAASPPVAAIAAPVAAATPRKSRRDGFGLLVASDMGSSGA